MSEQYAADTTIRLQELVHSTLARSPYLSGKNLRIEMSDEGVVLRGVVRSYYQKQIAQESIRSIEGVRQVRNELQVAW